MADRSVGDWVISTHIGSGSFAIVWKARHKVSGQEAAVKEIALDKLNAKLRQSLESEVSILKRIDHGNIVKLLEVFEEKNKLYLIMEFCAGGDLAHHIRKHKRVSEGAAQHFMQQLAAGLRDMWAHNLVHRDLKPQNLLLDGPGQAACLKIADFGFARNLQPQGLAETLCGSPLYMAPEILHFHKYDAKADLWSVGAILFELVVGRPPFNGANQFQLMRNIDRGEAKIPDSLASSLSLPCRQLIHALLRRNPVERISFEELFSHPFLTGPAPAPQPQPSFGLGQSVPMGRSFSANSIPQQVLGFHQQPLQAGAAAGGAHAGPAVVQPGQLSNQLKPRRSLDLDGIAQRAQQAAIKAQGGDQGELAGPLLQEGATAAAVLPSEGQQGSSAGQRQQSVLQRLHAEWGMGRPPQHHAHAGGQSLGMGQARRPIASATPHGSAPASLRWQQLQQQNQQAMLEQAPLKAVPTPPSQYLDTGAFQPPQSAPSERLAPLSESSAPCLAAPSAHGQASRGGSTHAWGDEDEDDYVLVGTTVSSHSRQPSPQPTEGAPALQATSSSMSSRQSCRSSCQPADEVFTVGISDEPIAVGAPPSSSWTTEDAELTPARWKLLSHTAHAIEALSNLAGGRPAEDEQAQQAAQRLSLCLASLQLLQLALDSVSVGGQPELHPSYNLPPPDTLPAAKRSLPNAAGRCQMSGEEVGAGQERASFVRGKVSQESQRLGDAGAAAQIQQDMLRVLGSAQRAAKVQLAAQQQGQEDAGAQGAPDPDVHRGTPSSILVVAGPDAGVGGGDFGTATARDTPLPDPWDLSYRLSLRMAKEAAVDELLGNLEHSAGVYSQVACILTFLWSEGPDLQLEPPLELSQQDKMRLQRYAAATSARRAVCMAQLGHKHQAAI